MSDLIKRLRKSAKCVHLIVEETIADDLSGCLRLAATYIEKRDARIEELEAQLDGKQARIDSLMQEYCPDGMTEKQWQEWERHQVPVSAGQEAELQAALEK